MSRSRLALITTGGTIGTETDDRLGLSTYAEVGRQLSVDQLLARVPELTDAFDVETVSFEQVYSGHLTTDHWLRLRALIESIAADVDGIVVTHGTGALEETAYFLHLSLNITKPVVVVGAMRPQAALGGDGELNLLNAARVASDSNSAGRGVLVVLNDAIFSARDVTKANTHRVDAFRSVRSGPLGYISSDGAVDYSYPVAPRRPRMAELNIQDLKELPRVDIVISYLGADGAMIGAAHAAGAAGIVNAGIGAGRPTPGESAALTRARAAGVVICQSSRVGSGRVSRTARLESLGFVAAGDLHPIKARILLMLGLTISHDLHEIQRLFDEA